MLFIHWSWWFLKEKNFTYIYIQWASTDSEYNFYLKRSLDFHKHFREIYIIICRWYIQHCQKHLFIYFINTLIGYITILKKKPYHFPISSYRFCIYLYVQFSTHILCILIKIIILLFCRLILTLPKCCFRFMTGKKTQLLNSECIYKCACSAVSKDSFFLLSLFFICWICKQIEKEVLTLMLMFFFFLHENITLYM